MYFRYWFSWFCTVKAEIALWLSHMICTYSQNSPQLHSFMLSMAISIPNRIPLISHLSLLTLLPTQKLFSLSFKDLQTAAQAEIRNCRSEHYSRQSSRTNESWSRMLLNRCNKTELLLLLLLLLWWALANPSCMPNLKSLASAIVWILKGNHQILGSSPSPGPRPPFLLHVILWWGCLLYTSPSPRD